MINFLQLPPEKFKHYLQTFILTAPSYNGTQDAYNNIDIPSLFDKLKDKLRNNKEDKTDIISLIVNYNEGSNGWIFKDSPIIKDKYIFTGIESLRNDNRKTNGLYSGKIAFRKELLEAAIEGGYLNNIQPDNLFIMSSVLPQSFKSILEACPNEILSYGRKNIANLIDKMQKNQFLTLEQSKEWHETFNKQIKNFPAPPSNNTRFFTKIMDNIHNLRSGFVPPEDVKKIKNDLN